MFGRDFVPRMNMDMDISPLQSLIQRAVDPYLNEPNYAAHIEVAEYINEKKANKPREAAMTIVRLVNNRNPHVSMLALSLLDTLVQSCGYPFHLQISTKEFLNELVRRFPERPPPFPGPVMTKILELINTWKETICTESRWREDLGNIRDMHRLLLFKGYRFQGVVRRQQPSEASTSNLKSAEELEEEDRAAQSAKLQELIRRGTPRDLAAAQELMKSLAGAEPDKKPDYRSQSLTELNKLESKVVLFNEMLDNVDTQRGEKFASGDVYDQVSSILTSARPKIQKWISEAESNDDPELLNIFLNMNDQINSVLNRYELFKKGDYVAASNPIPPEIASNSQSDGPLSLIDFDDSAPSSNVPSGGAANELAGLFDATPVQSSMQQPQQSKNPINLSQLYQLSSTPTQQPSNGQPQSHYTPNLFDALAGVGGGSPSPAGYSTSPPFGQGSIMLPGTPNPASQFTQTQPPGPGTGMRYGAPTQPHVSAPNPTANQAQVTKDPFADLSGLF